MAVRDIRATGHSERVNPFEVTKAVDFSDTEINATWVDWPAPGGFADFIGVRSPLTRFILGGKGTGRTHLMRHLSSRVQTVRRPEHPIGQVQDDGVLGIYVLCSGLNSVRFQGRSQDSTTWQAVFAQYADLWLAQAALSAFRAITAQTEIDAAVEVAIVADVMDLFSDTTSQAVEALSDLSAHLTGMTRDIDRAVNHAVLNPGRPLDLTLGSIPGSLVFGVPEAIRRHYSPLRNVTLLYLIDEFENFEEDQQKYVNSLVREKQTGTSFIIGVRTYGLRTHAVLGAREENKRGSEVEEILLDRKYTSSDRRRYREFCRQVISRRIFGQDATRDVEVQPRQDFRTLFERPKPDDVERMVRDRYAPGDRPYLRTLARQLSSEPVTRKGDSLAPSEVAFVLGAVRVPRRPLLEKVNALRIYRAWAAGKSVVGTAQALLDERPPGSHAEVLEPNGPQRTILSHYVTDLRAQLYDDMRLRPVYAGIDEFIRMSDGLPRNLLIILKNTYRWALFNGEDPYEHNGVSLESQQKGVYEAAEWFFADARPPGEIGIHVQEAIKRLGDMFRVFRFSDKPVESSLASFSADLTACSANAREVVELAEKWALVVRAERGQKDRNSRLLESKFHLNRLLSPLWDLPTARRGAVRLSATELNAIFDPSQTEAFPDVVNRRRARMNVPFRGGWRPRTRQSSLRLRI